MITCSHKSVLDVLWLLCCHLIKETNKVRDPEHNQRETEMFLTEEEIEMFLGADSTVITQKKNMPRIHMSTRANVAQLLIGFLLVWLKLLFTGCRSARQKHPQLPFLHFDLTLSRCLFKQLFAVGHQGHGFDWCSKVTKALERGFQALSIGGWKVGTSLSQPVYFYKDSMLIQSLLHSQGLG